MMLDKFKNTAVNETLKHIPPGGVGVELGVWMGETSEKFLSLTTKLYLVDAWSVEPYTNSSECGDYEGYINRYATMVGSRDPNDFQKYYDGVYDSVVSKLKNTHATIFRGTTDQFFTQFSDEKVDWIYVDASHSYEGCLQDLKNSLKIVKPGGFIFGDDYGNKKGVVKAVDTFKNETKLKFSNFYKNQYKIWVQ